MKYYGTVSDSKDLATKEYVDSHAGSGIGKVGTGTKSVVFNNEGTVSNDENMAIGSHSLAAGYTTAAVSDYSRSFGYQTLAGINSEASGRSCVAGSLGISVSLTVTKVNSSKYTASAYVNPVYTPNIGDPVVIVHAANYPQSATTMYRGKVTAVSQTDDDPPNGYHVDLEFTSGSAGTQTYYIYGFASANDTGSGSYANGTSCIADGNSTFAMGNYAVARGNNSFAFGNRAFANGVYAGSAGNYTLANARQTVFGKYNSDKPGPSSDSDTSGGSLFVVGCGTSSSRSNAFRVATNGQVYGKGSYSSTGADYAEYFEWADGNPNEEDRRGRFVTLDGEKIRLANENDTYILGVVSSNPAIIGDSFEDEWAGKYETDVFGKVLTRERTIPAYTDEEGVEHEEERFTEQILSENYDDSLPYLPRSERPEWSTVGLNGKLVVIDDGSCTVNGYCRPGANGTATAAEDGFRVTARVDADHIRIIMGGSRICQVR